jgi:hypothetical protein
MAMQGVAEIAPVVVCGVWQPVNREAMPIAENIAIKERFVEFIAFVELS